MEDTNKSQDPNIKLTESIKKFAASYNSLSAAGKTAFQTQIKTQLRSMDERTKKLYETLIEATKNGFNIEKTIAEMEKTDKSS